MRYLLRLTGDRELAADALQEAFTRLVEHPPRDASARAWLFTVATNIVREQGRATVRRGALLRRAPVDALHGDGAQDPAMVVERNERRDTVLRALATLSVRDRTVLLMREEGFSHAEIAEAVGTTTGSVGTIVARALRKLADALAIAPGGVA